MHSWKRKSGAEIWLQGPFSTLRFQLTYCLTTINSVRPSFAVQRASGSLPYLFAPDSPFTKPSQITEATPPSIGMKFRRTM